MQDSRTILKHVVVMEESTTMEVLHVVRVRLPSMAPKFLWEHVNALTNESAGTEFISQRPLTKLCTIKSLREHSLIRPMLNQAPPATNTKHLFSHLFIYCFVYRDLQLHSFSSCTSYYVLTNNKLNTILHFN